MTPAPYQSAPATGQTTLTITPATTTTPCTTATRRGRPSPIPSPATRSHGSEARTPTTATRRCRSTAVRLHRLTPTRRNRKSSGFCSRRTISPTAGTPSRSRWDHRRTPRQLASTRTWMLSSLAGPSDRLASSTRVSPAGLAMCYFIVTRAEPGRVPADGEHMSDEVLVERHGAVQVITINRPEARNALNAVVAVGIRDAVDELDSNPELRAGVLTGAGGTFSSGMDLKAFLRGETPSFPGRGLCGITQTPPRKPLVGAAEGWALAGGFELLLACDLVVA